MNRWCLAGKTPIGGPVWMNKIRTLLAEGYGVEDIGVIVGCHPDSVRKRVREFRESGELAAIYGIE